jgi:alpha-galactosidase
MTHLPLHLRAGGVSLVLAGDEGQVPHIAHWGSDLGNLDDEDLQALVLVGRAQLMPNTVDESHPVGVLAEHRTGWMGTPGLRGSRRGEHGHRR